MIKLMFLVQRKSGISRDEFRSYYESVHATLASKLMKGCVGYVRNFVTEEVTGPLGFDVVTEFWFDVDGPWQDAAGKVADPQILSQLQADEARFMDRASMQYFLVDERTTERSALLGVGRN